MSIQTPEQIANDTLEGASNCAARVEWLSHDHVHALITAAIEADRAQRPILSELTMDASIVIDTDEITEGGGDW